MTVLTNHYIKLNAIPLTTLFTVLSFIVYQSRWQSKVDNHIEDSSLHMPFERKIEVFVPRVELDGRIENIEKSQEEIQASQQKIISLLINKNN
jgi:hypothetical protein